MREGDVVLVVGEIDERVRPEKDITNGEAVYGTVVQIAPDAIEVLLPNGFLWRGPKREVQKAERRNDASLQPSDLGSKGRTDSLS